MTTTVNEDEHLPGISMGPCVGGGRRWLDLGWNSPSSFCCTPAVWPWARVCPSLSLVLLICEVQAVLAASEGG